MNGRSGKSIVIICLALFTTTASMIHAPRAAARDGRVPFRLAYLIDPSGGHDIGSISRDPLKSGFQPSSAVPNFGYTSSTVWFRVDLLEKPDNDHLLFAVNYPPLDLVEVYYPTARGEYLVKRSGDLFPFSHRDIAHRNYLFDIPHSTALPLFIKIRTESQVQLPLAVWHHDAFYSYDLNAQMIYGIYFGILIIMALYNFFIFISTREGPYAFYVLYVLSMLFFQLSQGGFAYELLWPDHPWWANRSQPFWTVTVTLWGTLFCISFLNIRKASRLLYYAGMAMALALLGLIIGSLTVSYTLSVRANTVFVPLNIIFINGLGVYMMYRHYRPARYFVIAWAAYLFFATAHALSRGGLIPRYFFAEYGPHIGSIIEVTLLAFALADRFNVMKAEKEEADRAMLVKQKEKESLERELQVAQHIQMSLLPGPIRVTDTVDIAYKYIPMSRIGGDFVDIHCRESTGDLGLFICDVSGHGVPAALTASMVKMSLNVWSENLDDPCRMLGVINESIRGKLGGNFITAQVCRLDLRSGALTVAGAGHPPAIIMRRSGAVEECRVWGRLIVEAFDTRFSEVRLTLGPGDRIILYTDCIIDAHRDHEFVGDGRFTEFLERNAELAPADLCEAVYKYIRDFTGKEHLQDDFTILIAEYRGPRPGRK